MLRFEKIYIAWRFDFPKKKKIKQIDVSDQKKYWKN